MEEKWLEWTREMQAIALSGLHYAKDPFDIERYIQLRDLSKKILLEYTQTSHSGTLDGLEADEGYFTPKTDVRAAIFQDNKILLVRSWDDNKWTLPGGYADVNLSPSENVVKEAKEETGYDVQITKLAAVLDRRKHNHPPHLFHFYKLFFLCEISGGMPELSTETLEIAFFQQNELPELSTGRTSESQIDLMFKQFKNPDLQAFYD
ncbi:MAG: NUDIX hydrolase [Cytophagaceae bacterium]